MGKFGSSRRSTAQPTTHGSTRRPRGDGRLDPVRWRRPGRGLLIRLVAVAALLATAAAVSWSPRQSCNVSPTDRVTSSAASRTTAEPRTGIGTGAATGSGTAAGARSGTGTGVDQARVGAAAPQGALPEGAVPEGAAPEGAVPEGAVPEGSVGVPIRLADPTALSLVHPGNRVDLLRIDDPGGHSTAVAGAALVLRVTGAGDPDTGGLLLALSPQEAHQAVISSRQGFAIVIRPG
jgi:hypothetical protein